MANTERGNGVAVFTACWTAIAAALGLLLIRLPNMPESVPVFVTILGTPTSWAPTSFATVARVPLMGAGQLLAVTGLARGSAASARWTRFFNWMAIAIAGKTVLESVMLAGTGTAWGDMTLGALQGLALLTVGAFVIYALVSWRRGLFSEVPALVSLSARLAVVLGVAVWAVFAGITVVL